MRLSAQGVELSLEIAAGHLERLALRRVVGFAAMKETFIWAAWARV
jgi:hypothetical protein